MSAFLKGFADELEKTAGLLGGVGKTLIKHPIATLTGAGIAASAGTSAVRGYRSGLQGGEKARYLLAGKQGPSEAFYTNFHPLFEHKLKPRQLRQLSERYREKDFKR